ncbi:MAG: hypothetical protein R3D55_09230 [Chloroflexota bacterium]
MFDNPLSGVPVFADGAEGDETLLLFSRSGKALRTQLADLRGSDAIDECGEGRSGGNGRSHPPHHPYPARHQ